MIEEDSHLKVLHIASGDLWAGAEVQLFTLANALHTIPGITIECILLNHGRLERELRNIGINVTVIDETRFNGINILLRLLTIIRKTKPDVIHTHRLKENILGCVAAYFSGNIPSIRTAHGASEHKPQWHNIPKRLILFIDWLCGRYLQKIIVAVSNDLAEILLADYPADKIKVIQNGIDTVALVRSLERNKSGIRRCNSSFKIGIAGRLVPVKRIDLFIQAAAEVYKHHDELNTSFHIFGDGPLLTELATLNQKLCTEEIIHFEGHCENMQQELSDLDILLITSDHEGLPMILLEAMALKTAVIAHAVGGMPTVLDQGTCGILVSDHQPSSYADAIVKLINNPVIRTNIIDNAFNRVTALYSSKRNATAYRDTYINLTDGANH